MNLSRGKSYHWHAMVGAGISLLCWLQDLSPVVDVEIAGWTGLVHEWADGCFTIKPGAPWSGILDTLAFLPGPVLRLTYTLVRS